MAISPAAVKISRLGHYLRVLVHFSRYWSYLRLWYSTIKVAVKKSKIGRLGVLGLWSDKFLGGNERTHMQQLHMSVTTKAHSAQFCSRFFFHKKRKKGIGRLLVYLRLRRISATAATIAMTAAAAIAM
jgi:hypothetical protein